ncbi:hypothetical protein C8A03DRAFT_19197 [Achaetomium macrosporum]|uniref:Uncharacterized protein n=1 Tax=Achaetomium macrosporum TaxID=79813 RepID=A0AAN7C215_9PEZI|nr:hypothetical protein C8A03DRAFT_19197 [Achaetomium macrosporum]
MKDSHDTVVPATAHHFTANLRRAVLGMLVSREDNCHPQPGVDLCEKPGISSTATTWIIVGVALGLLVFGTLGVLIFLHFRRRKQDKQEELEDRFQSSDYGLDELPSSRKPRPDDEAKWSNDGSPNGYGRRSRDPLQVGAEPKYQGGQSNGHLNPFDDATSAGSGGGSSYPPSVHQWPKRDSSSQPNLPAGGS